MSTLQELEDWFPHIRWREPQRTVLVGIPGERFVCRVCIVNNGLKGSDLVMWPADIESARKHFAEAHLSA